MTATLHDCVIRFWRETGTARKVAGTGFLAIGVDGQTYALTCAHVANLALGRNLTEDSPTQEGGIVTVDLMGRGIVTASDDYTARIWPLHPAPDANGLCPR
ncbi:hypothetical protein [Azospirillum sp. B510]|uniref:hypothetical protein n=1 Tax=Azospirillum sp. (strain B510) TaxID=137722 RepID=UPI0002D4AAB4|nr:hypothetical protein [Azospirillum sp. B510]